MNGTHTKDHWAGQGAGASSTGGSPRPSALPSAKRTGRKTGPACSRLLTPKGTEGKRRPLSKEIERGGGKAMANPGRMPRMPKPVRSAGRKDGHDAWSARRCLVNKRPAQAIFPKPFEEASLEEMGIA